ncbi:MAG: cytochrome b/b6 domain-containing protein [Gammaproteobacteria bacterium]
MTDKSVRVWDPLVRLFHWSLVLTFTVAWLSGEEESLLHIYSGYAVMGLILLRVFWGFAGTRYARFSDFLYSPRRTLRYLGSLLDRAPEHYTGHNPAGGWMIVLLLASLLVTGYTGIEVYGAEGHGPLAANGPGVEWVSVAYADDEDNDDDHHGEGEANEAEEFWEELHEFFAYFTLLLIFIHVAGVFVASRLHGENLVKAMISGNKQVP